MVISKVPHNVYCYSKLLLVTLVHLDINSHEDGPPFLNVKLVEGPVCGVEWYTLKVFRSLESWFSEAFSLEQRPKQTAGQIQALFQWEQPGSKGISQKLNSTVPMKYRSSGPKGVRPKLNSNVLGLSTNPVLINKALNQKRRKS